MLDIGDLLEDPLAMGLLFSVAEDTTEDRAYEYQVGRDAEQADLDASSPEEAQVLSDRFDASVNMRCCIGAEPLPKHKHRRKTFEMAVDEYIRKINQEG